MRRGDETVRAYAYFRASPPRSQPLTSTERAVIRAIRAVAEPELPPIKFEPCRDERCDVEGIHPAHPEPEAPRRGRPLRGQELSEQERLERRRARRAEVVKAAKRAQFERSRRLLTGGK